MQFRGNFNISAKKRWRKVLQIAVGKVLFLPSPSGMFRYRFLYEVGDGREKLESSLFWGRNIFESTNGKKDNQWKCERAPKRAHHHVWGALCKCFRVKCAAWISFMQWVLEIRTKHNRAGTWRDEGFDENIFLSLELAFRHYPFVEIIYEEKLLYTMAEFMSAQPRLPCNGIAERY